MENKKKPEVRFPTFEGDWEQRKLGESVKFLNGRAYKQQELLDIGKYRVLRVGNFNTNDKWYYSDLELEADKYANPGDLLYLWATSFGPEIWNEEKVIYHYHIWKLEIIDKSIDKEYLYTWLLTDKERIRQNTNGSTMVHVTKGNMEERRFEFPSDIIEQQKIGSFFRQLDDTITLHQQELTTLKQTKQGFLQKMFPKEGEKVPEVRFPGFTGDWEQRKLGGEAAILAGGDIDKMKLKGSGTYPVLANALTNDGIVGYYDEDYRIEAPAVTVTGRGDVGHAKARKTNFTPVVRLLAVKSEHDVDFLENAINEHKVLVESTGVPQLTSPQLGSYKIFFPRYEEEKRIGSFFKQLDDTITLHQRELELLQLTKKAFLQKLFV